MTTDKILLTGMTFYGYHGNNEEEARLGQRFVIDLELHIDLRAAGQTDRLEHTVNYSRVFKRVEEVVTKRRFRLLEALAEAIAQSVLEDTGAHAIMLRVKKPNAPIHGVFESAGVEIFRERAAS